jgi:hypothetical protein
VSFRILLEIFLQLKSDGAFFQTHFVFFIFLSIRSNNWYM